MPTPSPPAAGGTLHSLLPPGTELDIIGSAMLHNLEDDAQNIVSRPHLHKERQVSLARAKELLRARVESAWAPTTQRRRAGLWDRLAWWLRHNNLNLTPMNAALWLVSTGCQLQGELSYAKDLSAPFFYLGISARPLIAWQRILRLQGAEIPLRQAIPMMRSHLYRWVNSVRKTRPDLAVTALIGWKTASRWGDIQKLPVGNIIFKSPQEIIIDWFTGPKARRAAPFVPSRFCVIRGPFSKDIFDLLPKAAEYARRNSIPFTYLTGVGDTDITSLWLATAGMEEYSGHSTKHGASAYLDQLASEGVQVDPIFKSRVLKHLSKADPEPNTSIRYGNSPAHPRNPASIHKARALKTWKVTMLL